MVKKLTIKERNRRISEGLRLAWKRRKAGKMAEPATDESCRRCGFDKQSHDRWLPGTCECFQKELEIPTDKEVNEYRRIAESHSEKRGKMDSIVLRLLARLDAEITARQAAERRVEELERELRDTQTAFKAVCGVPED